MFLHFAKKYVKIERCFFSGKKTEFKKKTKSNLPIRTGRARRMIELQLFHLQIRGHGRHFIAIS